MRNIKLTIEYDGSRYQGWARLGKNESNNTISNKILEVLKKMTDESDRTLLRLSYRGGGTCLRTDC